LPVECIADAGYRVIDDLTRYASSLNPALHPLGERSPRLVCQRHYHSVN
jgi:hypothetical protein